MSDQLYLIAHKVRGEPAFDIAQRLQIGDEEGWIIPTSGHRAYPFWTLPMTECCLNETGESVLYHAPDMPPDLEDHYPARATPEAPKPSPASLLAALGLGKPKITIQRRL